MIATALFPNPVGASKIIYLKPELNVSHIWSNTVFWFSRCILKGKFLTSSALRIFDDGDGVT